MAYRDFALALWWGSARGFAHIGVIKFLEENQINPSRITGTSMWAIIGSLVALGYSSEKIKEIVGGVGVFSMLDFHIGNGILSIQKVKKVLQEYIWENKFSETKIPLFIIASNLSTGKKVVFSEWKILDAVCASIAIPWVFYPYKIGKDRFIDGGMRENLPLSPCGDLPILASSVICAQGISISSLPFLRKGIAVVQEAVNMMLEEQENLNISWYEDIFVIRTLEKTTGYMDFSNLELMMNEGFLAIKKSNILQFLQK